MGIVKSVFWNSILILRPTVYSNNINPREPHTTCATSQLSLSVLHTAIKPSSKINFRTVFKMIFV